MSVPDNYAEAAVRHLDDAEHLASLGRYDNAGHLVGFAGECAMKQKLRDLTQRAGENFHGHHPSPQTQLRTQLQRRGMQGQWLALCAGPTLFPDWDVNHRYSSDGVVTHQMYSRWLLLSKRLMSLAKIKR